MSARDDRGFAIYELLIVMTLALVVLSASLLTFNNLYQSEHTNDARNDTAEVARVALDKQARQLRNLAKRLNNSDVIDTVGDDDIIFQTSDPNRTWVRYCLDTTTAPATANRGRLWEAELSVPAATPSSPVSAAMKSGCPGTVGGSGGWSSASVVADYITNRRDGLARPLFTYTCTSGTSSCTSSPTTYDQLLNISAQTLVDTTPTSAAPELKVATSVYLRNQNQAPVAQFVAPQRAGSPRTVVLNASGSSDYEGRTLSFYWFKGTMPDRDLIRCDQPAITLNGSNQRVLWGGLVIGDGITLAYTFPSTDGASGTSQNVGLVACDPGDRYGTDGVPPLSASHPVTIPN